METIGILDRGEICSSLAIITCLGCNSVDDGLICGLLSRGLLSIVSLAILSAWEDVVSGSLSSSAVVEEGVIRIELTVNESDANEDNDENLHNNDK